MRFLVEMFSMGGLSGSPVFVLDFRVWYPKDGPYGIQSGYTFRLLGLIHGHWDEESVLDSIEQDKFLDNREFSKKMNVGMAVVVPAAKIKEMLNQDEVVQMQNNVIEEVLSNKNLPSPDVGFIDIDTSDEISEFTKENFVGDLKKASKPKKKDVD